MSFLSSEVHLGNLARFSIVFPEIKKFEFLARISLFKENKISYSKLEKFSTLNGGFIREYF